MNEQRKHPDREVLTPQLVKTCMQHPAWGSCIPHLHRRTPAPGSRPPPPPQPPSGRPPIRPRRRMHGAAGAGAAATDPAHRPSWRMHLSLTSQVDNSMQAELQAMQVSSHDAGSARRFLITCCGFLTLAFSLMAWRMAHGTWCMAHEMVQQFSGKCTPLDQGAATLDHWTRPTAFAAHVYNAILT